MTADLRDASGTESLPAALAVLAADYGGEVGALAALVLQHHAAAQAVAARSLVAAHRDPRLPSGEPARRIHVLRVALRLTLDAERRSGTVDPHLTPETTELLADAVARDHATHGGHRIPRHGLLAAMASLPARLRALVVLHDLFDLEPAELAAVAGGSAGRAARQVAEAEDRLRASLDDPGEIATIEEIGDGV